MYKTTLLLLRLRALEAHGYVLRLSKAGLDSERPFFLNKKKEKKKGVGNPTYPALNNDSNKLFDMSNTNHGSSVCVEFLQRSALIAP